MRTRIDYLADKYCFTDGTNRPVFAGSGRMFWRSVGNRGRARRTTAYCIVECGLRHSFELPFRLLLTRTPQLIAALVKNGASARKMWCSTINGLAGVQPEGQSFWCAGYIPVSSVHRIRRVVGNESTSSPYQQVAGK